VQRRLGFVFVLLTVISFSGLAQEDTTPRAVFLNPTEDGIIRNTVTIVVEGQNFFDLQNFGFVDFLFSSDGENFTTIGRDQNTFDGLSITWDTTTVPDGEYMLRAEVTDLVNTMGNGTATVFVNNNGNQSFTNRLMELLAVSFDALAQALNSPEEISLDEALGIIQENLDIGAVIIESVLGEIQTLSDAAPGFIKEMDPFLSQLPAIEKLLSATIDARNSIANLVLDEAQMAFSDMADALASLSNVQPNGFDFSPLAEVAVAVDDASNRLDELIDSIGGEGDSNTDEILAEFVEITRLAVPVLQTISMLLGESNETCLVRFSDSQNHISVQFVEAETERNILVDVETGSVELFNLNGDSLIGGGFSEGTFTWNGNNAGAETVYFVMNFEEDGVNVIKSGRLVVLP